MNTLSIPPNHIKALKDYLQLNEESKSEILNFLQQDDVVGWTPQYLAEKLEAFKPNTMDFKLLIGAFFSLASTHRRINTESFIDDVLYTVFKDQQVITEESKQALANVLGSKIVVSAKVFKLLYSVDKTYTSSILISDLRPIFNDDEELNLVGNVIMHNLRIEYTQNDEVKSLNIVLDLDDLLRLKDQLTRAEKKHQILTSTKEFKIIEVTNV